MKIITRTVVVKVSEMALQGAHGLYAMENEIRSRIVAVVPRRAIDWRVVGECRSMFDRGPLELLVEYDLERVVRRGCVYRAAVQPHRTQFVARLPRRPGRWVLLRLEESE
jgi:hypothetical protein